MTIYVVQAATMALWVLAGMWLKIYLSIPIGLLFELFTRKERAEEKSKRLNKLSHEDVLHDQQRNFEMAYSTFIKVEISKSERNPTLKILTDK